MLHYINLLWRPVVEILILWVVFYLVLLFIKGTRAFQVLKGLIILLLVVLVSSSLITQRLQLYAINWIVEKLFTVSVIAFLIIFQPELRQGLAKIGQEQLFTSFLVEPPTIEEIIKAAFILSRKKIGAIIAIEREIPLKAYMESGIMIDSKVTAELLNTIFMPNTPLHDGGVIIHGERIVAAGCLFPLTQNPKVSKTLGTRHRAAMGLTEETDAVVLVVSEETGAISISISGKLTRDLDRDSLEKILVNLCKPKGQKKPGFFIRPTSKITV